MKQQTVAQISPAAAPGPPTSFDTLVAAVAAGRWRANGILEQLATARQQFDEQIRPLVEQKDAVLTALASAEEALRTATLAAYESWDCGRRWVPFVPRFRNCCGCQHLTRG